MSDFNRVPASAFIGNAVASSAVAQADYDWMVENGAPQYDAAARTIGATSARWIVGLFSAPWLIIAYYVGTMLIFLSTPMLFMQYFLRWEMPVYEVGGFSVESWTEPSDFGLQWVASLLGGLLCLGLVYGVLLIFSHIWRWQTNVVPGYNDGKRWWRMYKRPVMNTIYPAGDPRRGIRYGFATALKWIFLYIPAGALPLYFLTMSLLSIAHTAVHNV